MFFALSSVSVRSLLSIWSLSFRSFSCACFNSTSALPTTVSATAPSPVSVISFSIELIFCFSSSNASWVFFALSSVSVRSLLSIWSVSLRDCSMDCAVAASTLAMLAVSWSSTMCWFCSELAYSCCIATPTAVSTTVPASLPGILWDNSISIACHCDLRPSNSSRWFVAATL